MSVSFLIGKTNSLILLIGNGYPEILLEHRSAAMGALQLSYISDHHVIHPNSLSKYLFQNPSSTSSGQKLALVSFPDELEGAGWDYGVPLADIKRLVRSLERRVQWRAEEAQVERRTSSMLLGILTCMGWDNEHSLCSQEEPSGECDSAAVRSWMARKLHRSSENPTTSRSIFTEFEIS
ncbi:hypothetical protein BT96DRAFT_1010610 [Gymnopus androsaceus JB14]|uniref:Epoxide hydrolase N-terminal domain-containing protein n=1 Tax=Gymnopus androsaceus JB14 TaxID=1447944 RepID=A0A6A4GAL6_9AGAR|nr:hypothetical protein BT96DRAFT_1010610 [Gymnopus androsaceus JB14]